MDIQDNCRATGEEGMEAAEMAFVAGDRGAGLVIVGLGGTEHRFRHGAADIGARLEATALAPEIRIQTLKLDMTQPTRFRIEWLIPETAVNAAMTLNGGLLISPFAPDWPEGAPELPTPACGQQTPVSTLHAGRFQALDFMWEGGDVLTLYLVLSRAEPG